jgi:hypothetical protein
LEPLVHFINGVSRVKSEISRPTTGIQTKNVGVASTRGERRRAGAHSSTREREFQKWVAVDWAGGWVGRHAKKRAGEIDQRKRVFVITHPIKISLHSNHNNTTAFIS